MPDVRNCKRCGRIFNYIGGQPICHACREKEEADFRRVKEYLYENPGATLSEVSSALDISVEQIKHYLREGRLEIVGNERNLILECERCGKSITTGRYCNECAKELEKGLKATAREMSKKLSDSEDEKRSAVWLRYVTKYGDEKRKP